jgi:hypothetical protein
MLNPLYHSNCPKKCGYKGGIKPEQTKSPTRIRISWPPLRKKKKKKKREKGTKDKKKDLFRAFRHDSDPEQHNPNFFLKTRICRTMKKKNHNSRILVKQIGLQVVRFGTKFIGGCWIPMFKRFNSSTTVKI